MKASVTRLLSLGFCVWAIGLLVAYYNTWGPSFGLSLGAVEAAYNVGFTLVILTAFFLTGRRLQRFVLARVQAESTDSFVTPMALGMTAAIAWVSVLGFAGLLYDWLILVGLLASIVLCLKDAQALVAAGVAKAKSLAGAPNLKLGTLVLWALPICFAAIAAVQAFAPPIGPDELIHHLNGPMRRLQTHSFAYTDETRDLAGMQNATVLYAICLSGPAGDAPAKLMNFAILLLFIATIRLICRRHFPSVCPAWTSTLVLSQPVLAYVSNRPYSDLLASWMVLLALVYALTYVKDRAPTNLILSGLFLGVALGTRLTMAYAVLGTGAALFITLMLQGDKLVPAALRSSVLGFVSLGTTLGWLAWNWHYVGSPLFPIGQGMFGSSAQPLADSFFPAVNASLTTAHDFTRFLLLPLTMTFSLEVPNRLWGNILLPGYLALSPLVLLLSWRSWQTRFLIIFTIVYFVLWSRNMSFLRYIMPVFAAYSILCIHALHELRERLGGISGAALRALSLVGLVLVPGSLELYTRVADHSNVLALAYAGGRMTREQFYAATGNAVFRMSQYCNQSLDPKTSRIRLFGEAQTYYLQVPHFPDGLTHGELYDLEERAGWNGARMRKLLTDKGFTHVIFNRGAFQGLFLVPGAVYGRAPEIREKAARSVSYFAQFAREELELLHEEGPMALYRFK